MELKEHVALDDALDVRYREQRAASREHLENEFVSLVYDGLGRRSLLDMNLHAAKSEAKSKPKPKPEPKPRLKPNGPRTKPKPKPKTKSDDYAKKHCGWLFTNLFEYINVQREFLEFPHLERFKQDVIEKALLAYVDGDVIFAAADRKSVV